MGALLRREEACTRRLLTNWRRQREAGALRKDARAQFAGDQRRRPVDPRVKQLETKNRRLQRKLQRAEINSFTLTKKSLSEDPGDPPDTPRSTTRPTECVPSRPSRRQARRRRCVRVVGVSRASLYSSDRRPAPRSTPTRPRAPIAARVGHHRTPGRARRVAQRAVRRPVARLKCQ